MKGYQGSGQKNIRASFTHHSVDLEVVTAIVTDTTYATNVRYFQRMPDKGKLTSMNKEGGEDKSSISLLVYK